MTVKPSDLATWPADLQRIGLWFAGGLAGALQARQALGWLRHRYPTAHIVVMGEPSCSVFFELEAQVIGFVGLQALSSLRTSQSTWIARWQAKRQHRQLQTLELDACLGVLSPCFAGEWQPVFCMSALSAWKSARRAFQWPAARTVLIESAQPDPFTLLEVQAPAISVHADLPMHGVELAEPLLQAGPEALRTVQRDYQRLSAHARRVLVILGSVLDEPACLQQRYLQLLQHMQHHPFDSSSTHLTDAHYSPAQREPVHVVWFIQGPRPRLWQRMPNIQVLNEAQCGLWSELIGHVAQADHLISCVPWAHSVIAAMHRQNRQLSVVL